MQGRPATLEGQAVRLADVAAYVSHDLDDAIRAGLIAAEQVPADLCRQLGRRHGERINNMVVDLISASLADGLHSIRFSPAVGHAITELRDWLFRCVYQAVPVVAEFHKASHMLCELFRYFIDHPDELAACGGRHARGDDLEIVVADFLAGMTDRYAMNLYQQRFLPQPWKVL